MAAGQYSSRLRWWQCIRTTDALGQPVERFRSNGYLWASIDTESPRRQADYGTTQTGADADIRVRQFPSLSALDRLTDGSDVWIIESIAKVDNETVCRCSRFDQLEEWKVDITYEASGGLGGVG